ncbi:MAG: hypothetical protein DIU78_020005 [Pseudomonadota bacterium]|nr:MAG: hypothetical protein DIU78_10485 [Pseudomonadota bacterium]
MQPGAPTGRILAMATIVAALTAGACRTSNEDIERWATRSQGPKKLVAVLVHDKYPLELRVEAALTLIGIKPRNGRRVGIQGSDEHIGFVAALAQLSPAARAAIVEALVPRLEAEMRKPFPKSAAGQPAAGDPSAPYKDAAFALLTHDGGALVADPELRARLRSALATWSTTNFAERIEDPSQIYGIEQVMRELRAEGARLLPPLMVPNAAKIDRMAELVADFGDPATKLLGSQRLVAIANYVASNAWIEHKTPIVQAANKASKLNPSPERFQQQLKQYQEEELLRVMASMKRLGGRPVVDYLLAFARDESRSEKLRASAMAALQNNLDRNDPAHADAVLEIARAPSSPDQLRDVALQRAAEFPRSLVIDKLYGLFSHDNWKVRWVAADLVLRMSEAGDLEGFFTRLGKIRTMAIAEPLRYGSRIAALKGTPPVVQLVERYTKAPHSAPVRLSALAYYYAVGTPSDVSKVSAYASDRTAVPSCPTDAQDCEWKCDVPAGAERETKDIKTIGDFVTYCIVPAMQARQGGKT